MRSIYLLVIIGLLSVLAACQSKEAEQFIKQESTVEEAQQLVEEAMRDKGLTVSAGKVQYDNIGKSADTSRVVVDYETEHDPVYKGRAFLNVDEEAKPRRFAGLDHLGLERTEGLITLGDVLMEKISTAAHQSAVPKVEELRKSISGLSWEESEKIIIKQVEYNQEMFPELLRLYAENRLGNPSEEEAKEWMEQYKGHSDNDQPEMWLPFNYAGEMTNTQFETILERFGNLEDLWGGPLYVRITADRFDESEEPIYNKYSNGKGSNVFIGGLE
ncbi:hypothetical protein M3197_13745 [Sporosarcina aquimarina]|uniref:hypothetical protein n=1 Tax=Sporosarcina aquimarina TaxID=114975 RepID=UPI00203C0D30|nr:hypothetical protein [Sporosarcina aquimarina]MCM3758525.1 hypothetical protein [Sporosarcina aquimarina]